MSITFTFKTGTATDLKTKKEKQIGRFVVHIKHSYLVKQLEMWIYLIDNDDTLPNNFSLESIFEVGDQTWEIEFFNCTRDVLDKNKFNCEKRIGKKVFVMDEIVDDLIIDEI